MQVLLPFDALPWLLRIPVKWLVFALTVFLACFPYPNLFLNHVQRWRNPNSLIDPAASELQPMIADLTPRVASAEEPAEVLHFVQQYVYENIAYDWDWNTWGLADYIPTVGEAVLRGTEDCDGRAVVAASLLKHFGFQPQIVTDFAHVWVKTEHGPTMSPGAITAIEAADGGLLLRGGALQQAVRGMAFGVAAFPFAREFIILAVGWWLLLRRRCGFVRQAAGLAFLLNGLVLLRLGGSNYHDPQTWVQVLGLGNLALGLMAMLFVRPVRRTTATPVESLERNLC